ncbi:MAG TPA: hypothetical protein VFA53_11905 [Xanthobacteraceae bacterium]|nr:hypothetical protein [Xanthobacteraceae bacterium]
MRHISRCAFIGVALFTGATMSAAQDNKPATPNPAAGATAPQVEQAPADAAAMAPAPMPDPGPALVNGKLNPSGTPAEAQTEPAKYSQRNDALDKLPIMAHPLPLNDEQKQAIYHGLTQAQAPTVKLDAKPAQSLPLSVTLNDLPAAIAQNYPSLRGYKFVRAPDKLLLVNPAQRVVVGEIKGS